MSLSLLLQQPLLPQPLWLWLLALGLALVHQNINARSRVAHAVKCSRRQKKSTSVKSTFFYQFLSTVLTPSKMMPTHGVPSSSPPKI
jgi:hypothetical protein